MSFVFSFFLIFVWFLVGIILAQYPYCNTVPLKILVCFLLFSLLFYCVYRVIARKKRVRSQRLQRLQGVAHPIVFFQTSFSDPWVAQQRTRAPLNIPLERNLSRRISRTDLHRAHPLTIRFAGEERDLLFYLDLSCVTRIVHEAILNLQEGGKS